MNENIRTQLKIIVERVVRPIVASRFRKRTMREEMLSHVSAVFEEERERLGDEQAALEQTGQRFGDPAAVARQLQESVPARDALLRHLENLIHRPGESTMRRATRFTLLMFAFTAPIMLPGFYMQGRLKEWPLFVAFSLLTFGATFLAHWMRQAIQGPLRRNWMQIVLVSVATWVFIPAVVFGICLAYSGEVQSSLVDALAILPLCLLGPLVMAILVQMDFARGGVSEEGAYLTIN